MAPTRCGTRMACRCRIRRGVTENGMVPAIGGGRTAFFSKKACGQTASSLGRSVCGIQTDPWCAKNATRPAFGMAPPSPTTSKASRWSNDTSGESSWSLTDLRDTVPCPDPRSLSSASFLAYSSLRARPRAKPAITPRRAGRLSPRTGPRALPTRPSLPSATRRTPPQPAPRRSSPTATRARPCHRSYPSNARRILRRTRSAPLTAAAIG
jgi:hypothetical protein